MFHYVTLDDIDVNNKIIGVRIDINSPIINNNVHLNERIIQSCITIKELQKKGAKIVLLAHQSRKGKPDCVSLKHHKPLLEKQLKTTIYFTDSFSKENIKKQIFALKESEMLLLENLRFIDDETDSTIKQNKITQIISLFDYYVFDAFSVSHRPQASVLGSPSTITVAGRLLEKELQGLQQIEEKKQNRAFVFGGAKPDDLLVLIEYALEHNEVEEIFLTGVIGELALILQGYHLGKKQKSIHEQGWDSKINVLKKLMEKYPEKFIFPKDVAYLDDNGKRKEIEVSQIPLFEEELERSEIMDIGEQTIQMYSTLFPHYSSIYVKGPAGFFEDKHFEKGTKQLLEAIVDSGAFTYLGGGHSITCAKDFGVIDKLSYTSLAGGALVDFLSGKQLPGIETLQKSFLNFYPEKIEYVVVGSNVIDTEVSIQEKITKTILGKKIKTEEDFKTTIGGGGINVSICLSRLHAGVGYLGKYSFESEKEIKKTLQKNKVYCIENKTSKKPASKSIIIDSKEDNDRVIVSYRGQNQDLSIEDTKKIPSSAKYFYFTSLSGNSFLTLFSLAKTIKQNKESKICYNPSSYLIEQEPKKVSHLIKQYVDVLVLNLEEAKQLTSLSSISEILTSLYKQNLEVVVVTCGKHGAYAYDGKEEYYQPATSTKVVDTTGAGDSFASTFFYFYTKKNSIKTSLYYAAKNSANVVSYKGAIDGLMHLDDILELK
jgi:phosphoglycerate kinase